MDGAITGVQAVLQWGEFAAHELLLFAAFWFMIGLLDELAVDLCWLWLRLTGRVPTHHLPAGFGGAALAGRAAVLIPTWQEAPVIGATLRHALAAWPQTELRIYVGVYRNDPATMAAVIAAAGNDVRVRLVVHDRAGPTTKADCLNRLYAALGADEARGGWQFRSVLLHDAEDMVHPAALQAIDHALEQVDFVQIPVRPELVPHSRWIASHYADEFAEAHAKMMVVRSALHAAIPAAGVGCGFARAALGALAVQRQREGEGGPFAAECLTEDYELGLLLSQQGRGSQFLRLRDAAGALVATRSCFPDQLDTAVRQKTRWVHGIAFQSWDRLGWSRRPIDFWMSLRDRRGPMTAVVLTAAYTLLVLEAVLMLASLAGWYEPVAPSYFMQAMLALGLIGFLWRAGMRLVFTTREYGLAEGLRAVLRIPLANIIAIISGRRALMAYLRSLNGAAITWDKTTHSAHPALPAVQPLPLVQA